MTAETNSTGGARVLGPEDGHMNGPPDGTADRFMIDGEDSGGGLALVEHPTGAPGSGRSAALPHQRGRVQLRLGDPRRSFPPGRAPVATIPPMTIDVSTVTLANGLTLSYADQGARSEPPVVLVPGATDSLWSYQPVLERLRPSIRAIAVSARGHGDSDKPATGYRVDDFAADIVRLLDALDIERAVLVGHSSSCLITRRVAIDSPERVAGLVLEASPTTLRGHAALEGFVDSVLSDLRDPIDEGLARAFVTDTSSDQLSRELVETLVQEVTKVPPRVWREMFGALLQYDDTAELGRITTPALLVWGDADGLATRAMQEELARAIPGARLLVYEGVGHTPRWEDPDRFASDLAAFVEVTGADRG